MARTRRAKSKGKKPRYSGKRKYSKRKYSKKRAVKRTTKRSGYTKKRPVMRRRKSYRKSSGPSIGEMSWVVNNFGGGVTSMETPQSMPRKYQKQEYFGDIAMSNFPDLGEFKSGYEI